MFTNFPLGLAFGLKMAERSGVTDTAARRRAGIVLGAAGFTPAGLVVTKTMIDREVAAEAAAGAGKDDSGVGVGVVAVDPVARAAAEAVADVLPLLRLEVERVLDPAVVAQLLAAALAERLSVEQSVDVKALADELAGLLAPVVRDAAAGVRQAKAPPQAGRSE